MSDLRMLRIAVFAPLRSTFDYVCPRDIAPAPQVGARVLVPFGHSNRLGVVLEVGHDSAVAISRLKPILRLLDVEPLLDKNLFALALWVADYYHHPLGEVFETLLPTKLRRAEVAHPSLPLELFITDEGRRGFEASHKCGRRQEQILRLCLDGPISSTGLQKLDFDTGRVTRALLGRGWLAERLAAPRSSANNFAPAFLSLNPLQSIAYDAVTQAPLGYAAHVLHGITGSGKTEIYLHLIRDVITAQGQSLVLVPEIGLTEQLVMRFRERFGADVAIVHSGLSEAARAATWQACRENIVKVVLGTRSAVWLPLPALRLVIVDEEHDLSYKQQDGLRYSARDVAVIRAHRANIPIVLGSATPSLESLANCERKKYAYIPLTERAGGAALPEIKLIDIRGLPLKAGMSDALHHEISAALLRGEQSLVFLNRRGYAPIVLCHHCGWIASCDRCDARLVLHSDSQRLRCHHCGANHGLRAPFAAHPCGPLSEYVDLGIGTEQVEETLTEWFPERKIVRIDRDSMPRKGQLEQALKQVSTGQVDILVGTQMISKGHDFAGITIVGILDADSRLHASDFRAEERFIQLVLQVAGRAGRAERAGLVLIQTHHPHHPIFEFIISGRYKAFAEKALLERAAAELPPYYPLALLRAEAITRSMPMAFLKEVAIKLKELALHGVSINGPIPALMEKRHGKFRANLLLTALERGQLSFAINQLMGFIDALPSARRVRWSLDIDAQEVA